MPNIWPPASTVITRNIMTENGSVNRTWCRRPRWLVTVTRPPSRSMAERTASIPTPRPDNLVTVAAVENPGEKISSVTA